MDRKGGLESGEYKRLDGVALKLWPQNVVWQERVSKSTFHQCLERFDMRYFDRIRMDEPMFAGEALDHCK